MLIQVKCGSRKCYLVQVRHVLRRLVYREMTSEGGLRSLERHPEAITEKGLFFFLSCIKQEKVKILELF